MTDTKEFNKSLDRIAKALGGEEWTPEDKPEAMYKLLDKIADKLEENGTGEESTDKTLIVHLLYNDQTYEYTFDHTYAEIKGALINNYSVMLVDIDNNQIFSGPYYPAFNSQYVDPSYGENIIFVSVSMNGWYNEKYTNLVFKSYSINPSEEIISSVHTINISN